MAQKTGLVLGSKALSASAQETQLAGPPSRSTTVTRLSLSSLKRVVLRRSSQIQPPLSVASSWVARITFQAVSTESGFTLAMKSFT